ncbi:hypothetical protein PV04_01024 [Phialophora macrospora]|uniref:Glycosyl hydrolase family 32 C-terminal domain-containing protein n=1 Tax=Phialophora macrospora TaxID=1851006 RepID=A0A0D2G241_9EURO|nr:hypothetical protein PV04_01024 [Phialophora macrospora]
MWMHGSIKIVDGNPTMEYDYGGRLDHGRRYYAPNSFWDPISQHHVIFAWLQENDLPELWHERQAWSGMLSLPRILRHTEMFFVCGTLATPLEEITSIRKELNPQGTYTISTLASAPHPALEQLRGGPLPFPTPTKKSAIATFAHPTKHLEIDISCLLPREVRRLGLSILHSSDAKQRTTMYFDAAAETFLIDRSQSTTITDVDTAPEVAPHTLFLVRDDHGAVAQEFLDVRAFYDVSALEVFVNERTAIATRIYPDHATCFGIEVFLEFGSGSQSVSDSDAGGGVVWRRSHCWEILSRQAIVI